MPKKRTVWTCEFGCGKILVRKDGIVKHELTCWRNPARRACFTCKYNNGLDVIRDDHDCGHNERICTHPHWEYPQYIEKRLEKYCMAWDCSDHEPIAPNTANKEEA